MPDPIVPLAAWLAVSPGGGPGTLLKWVVVISVVGTVLLAWFLLRGYKDGD